MAENGEDDSGEEIILPRSHDEIRAKGIGGHIWGPVVKSEGEVYLYAYNEVTEATLLARIVISQRYGTVVEVLVAARKWGQIVSSNSEEKLPDLEPLWACLDLEEIDPAEALFPSTVAYDARPLLVAKELSLNRLCGSARTLICGAQEDLSRQEHLPGVDVLEKELQKIFQRFELIFSQS